MCQCADLQMSPAHCYIRCPESHLICTPAHLFSRTSPLTHFVYDGSFEGLLTAVFDVYDRKAAVARIEPMERYQPDAFASTTDVVTDEAKAIRVW